MPKKIEIRKDRAEGIKEIFVKKIKKMSLAEAEEFVKGETYVLKQRITMEKEQIVVLEGTLKLLGEINVKEEVKRD